MVTVKVGRTGQVESFRLPNEEWVVLGATSSDRLLGSVLTAALPLVDSMYSPNQCREAVSVMRQFVNGSQDCAGIMLAINAYIDAVPVITVDSDLRTKPNRHSSNSLLGKKMESDHV